MADLIYGANVGCIAQSSTASGTPGQCGGDEHAAVPHRYRYPRPHATRIYVCDVHAEQCPDAEPLTDNDRRIIAERRERRRAQLAAARSRTS